MSAAVGLKDTKPTRLLLGWSIARSFCTVGTNLLLLWALQSAELVESAAEAVTKRERDPTPCELVLKKLKTPTALYLIRIITQS